MGLASSIYKYLDKVEEYFLHRHSIFIESWVLLAAIQRRAPTPNLFINDISQFIDLEFQFDSSRHLSLK